MDHSAVHTADPDHRIYHVLQQELPAGYYSEHSGVRGFHPVDYRLHACSNGLNRQDGSKLFNKMKDNM